MTEILAGAVVALIGGFFAYLTTGPALGATRSRRAARELLELRSALSPADIENRAALTAALEKEINELGRLGNTTERRGIAATAVCGGLILVAWFAMAVPTFLIQEGQKELMRYISSGAYLLAIGPLYAACTIFFGQASRTKVQIGIVIVGVVLWVALSAAALIVVQETEYYRQLTAL